MIDMTLQQSLNHVTSSMRQTATGRRRRDNHASASMTDRREDDTVGLAGCGEDRASEGGLENVVTEEHQEGFKLRVRFLMAPEPQSSPRCAGGRNSSGTSPATTRSKTSVDARLAAVQHHLTDRSDESP